MKPYKTSLNPDHLNAVIEVINKAPFFKHLSMEVVELGPGFSLVKARIEKNYMNPFGGLHGGVYSALLDTAAYWSAYCDLSEQQGLVTIDIKVDLLAPVVGTDVVVKGKVVKAGRSLFLTEAQLFDDNDRVLAHATSKLFVTNDKQTISDVLNYIAAPDLPNKYLESSSHGI